MNDVKWAKKRRVQEKKFTGPLKVPDEKEFQGVIRQIREEELKTASSELQQVE